MIIDFAHELNAEQFRAVREASGPSLVLAGAGSGKTRTIVYRVAYLLSQGASPADILLLTFTNKAAQEMLGRVEYLVHHGAKELWGGTFHHISARVLRHYAPLIGYKSNFSILDQDDSRNLIKLSVGDIGIDVKSRRFPSPNVLQDIFSLSRNKQASINECVLNKHSSFYRMEQEIENIFRTYSDKKRAANSMDFDDLLLNFVLLLKNNSSVLHALRTKWKHILVDEYQDTNPIQGELIKLLYSDATGSSLLAVGDDAQSIYSFRGATIENILEFPRIYPDTKIFRLETNYRSVQPILNLANAVIIANERQFEKVLRGVKSEGEKPKLIIAGSSGDEAGFIAEKILEFRDQGTPLNHIAVLFRAAYQSEFLEFELTKRDIPYEYRGGMRFFERAHIKDTLSYLRILVNPEDEISWLRVLSLMPGIGTAISSRIFAQLRGKNDLGAILDGSVTPGSRAEASWQELAKMIRKICTIPRNSVKEILDSILDLGYREYLESEYPDYKDRLEDIEQLKIFASNYENIADFVGEVSLFEHFGAKRGAPAPEDQELLVLSTIHQAKGLEWDAVFILGLVNTAFPNRRALTEKDGLEEERRLFYVAITRARKFLFLSYPLVGGVDSVYLNQPSMFLDEVDSELFSVIQIQSDDSKNDLDTDNGDYPTINIGDRGLLPEIKDL